MKEEAFLRIKHSTWLCFYLSTLFIPLNFHFPIFGFKVINIFLLATAQWLFNLWSNRHFSLTTNFQDCFAMIKSRAYRNDLKVHWMNLNGGIFSSTMSSLTCSTNFFQLYLELFPALVSLSLHISLKEALVTSSNIFIYVLSKTFAIKTFAQFRSPTSKRYIFNPFC